MIMRSPTRTKTMSFNGPQNDFLFPSHESFPKAIEEYKLNNHHLLNETVGRKSSTVYSDFTGSQAGYSFANISDNSTTDRSRSQYGTSSSTTFGSQAKTFNSQLTTKSARTTGTIPTADVESFKITPASSLKRSNAVRCKNGLLAFFSSLTLKTRRAVVRLLRKFNKKLHRKNTTVKRNVTLLRTASLMRSRSLLNSPSLSSIVISRSPSFVARSSSMKRYSSSIRSSIRRSPSSIKRAASNMQRSSSAAMVRSQPYNSLSNLTRAPSIVVNNQVFPLRSTSAGALSTVDENLTEIIEDYEDEPKLIERIQDYPSVKMQHIAKPELCVVEEPLRSPIVQKIGSHRMPVILDDIEEQKEQETYVVDSESEDSEFHDIEEIMSDDGLDYESACEDLFDEQTLETWKRYLSTVISERIKMRITMMTMTDFENEQISEEYAEKLEDIMSDMETDYSDGFDTPSRISTESETLSDEDNISVSSEAVSMFAGQSFTSNKFSTGVRRAITLPMGH